MALRNKLTRTGKSYSVGYSTTLRVDLMQIVTGVKARYYKISRDEYTWFTKDPARLDKLAQLIAKDGAKSTRFFCSSDQSENSPEQMKRFRTLVDE